MVIVRLFRFALPLLLVTLLAGPAVAQEPDPEPDAGSEMTVEELKKLVDEMRYDMTQMRAELERVRAEVRELKAKMLTLRAVESGPPAPKGGPVNFTVPGTVMFVAREGEIEKGDLLIELDRTEALTNLADFQERLKSAEAGLKIARRWLAESQGKVTQAQIMWEQAKSERDRVGAAVRAGREPEGALDAANRRVSEAFQTLGREKGRLLGREVHVRNSENAIPELKAAIERQAKTVEAMRIIAPQDGTVSNVRVKAGEFVSPADVVLDFTPAPESDGETGDSDGDGGTDDNGGDGSSGE